MRSPYGKTGADAAGAVLLSFSTHDVIETEVNEWSSYKRTPDVCIH
jgi:hypothetical protein